MSTTEINKRNVGRIAERIVANELEARGFRVSDLNSDGTAANADLLAVRCAQTLQVQVKGAVNGPNDKRWWVQYGYCTPEIIASSKIPMFNRSSSFYEANVVVLVAVRSPHEYCCVVLPIIEAERAAQLNLEHDYRMPKHNGQPKKPNKVWVSLAPSPRAKKSNKWLDQEREILNAHCDQWDAIGL